MFVSEHDQQSLACNLMLPQPRNDQTGLHTQSASSLLDEPQGGSGQYQPSGNNPTPLTTGASDQPTGNDQTPLAGEGLNSTAIVDAQLTPPISRDDEAERQDALRDDDAQMPDAPTVHDIATPRRQMGGRCRRWCSSTQPTSDKRKRAACCMRGQQFSNGEARLQQWSNREPNNACVDAHCQQRSWRMTMSCNQSNPWIRRQLSLLLASAKVSSGQRPTQKSSCPWPRTQIKPSHLPLLMMSRTCLDVKRLHQGPARHDVRTTPPRFKFALH